MHTAGQSVERLLLLDVDGKRSVTATTGLRTGPLGGGHHGLRCGLGHGEGNTTFLVTFCQVHQVQTGLLLELLEALNSNLTVRGTGNHEDCFRNLHVGIQCRTACALTGVHHTEFLSHLRDFVLQIVSDELGGGTELIEQRANGGVHIVQCAVVTLDGDEVRHVLAGHAHHTGGVLPVGCVTARLSNLAGSVVQQRNRNDILTDAEVLLSQASELVCQSLEGLVVGLCLPRRINCRGERVQERVHIGRGDIVLLVPGSSRQNDVRQQGRGGHTEVRGDQQIQLALRCVVDPLHFVRVLLRVGTLNVVHATDQVLQEVALTLSGGTEQVRTPQGQGTRPVDGVVDVLNGELQVTGVQALCNVVRVRGSLAACHCLLCLISQFQRVLGELREERHPAHAHGACHNVSSVNIAQLALSQRGLQVIGGVCILTELVSVHVPEAGTDHVTRRAAPVQSVSNVGQTSQRTCLLLAHVVSPTATVTALGTGQVQQGEDSAVGGISVVPLADTCTEDNHGAATGIQGALSELTGNADNSLGGDRSNLLLPCRGVLNVPVLVVLSPGTGQALAAHTVLCQHDVEDSGDFVAFNVCYRHTAGNDVAVTLRVIEGRHLNLCSCCLALGQVANRQNRLTTLQIQVPLALVFLSVTVTHGAVGHEDLTGLAVHQHGLKVSVRLLSLTSELCCGQELGGDLHAVLAGFQGDQEGKIGVGQGEVLEELDTLVDVVLLEDNVTHCHCQCRVGTCLCGQPLVSELGVVGVVGAHGDNLGTAVADLGDPVSIRGTGQRNVCTPHDEVCSVPPVARLGHIGLVAEDLRGSHGKVGVPVVEAGHHATGQLDVANTRTEGGHGHCRNRGEAGVTVGAVVLDGVHVSSSHQFESFSPGRAHQTTLTACVNVACTLGGVRHDGVEGVHGIIVDCLRFAVHLQQETANVGVLNASGRVGVPRECRTAGATAGLVLGAVGTNRGVVGFLCFPGDNAVLDVHLPGAGAGAVHAVGRANFLIVAPTVAVEGVTLAAAFTEDGAAVFSLIPAGEKLTELDQLIGKGAVRALNL